ncbi:hypothetical protein RRG08_047947 [Elysia crispata]|uniref:Uncharacterized protein n=1 Tax=Elysia crispata TaxID=231223 RepID=A0AAE0XED5_9GAST|nr:hypothetical protein RRG08_047947 [Elysia crispata]
MRYLGRNRVLGSMPAAVDPIHELDETSWLSNAEKQHTERNRDAHRWAQFRFAEVETIVWPSQPRNGRKVATFDTVDNQRNKKAGFKHVGENLYAQTTRCNMGYQSELLGLWDQVLPVSESGPKSSRKRL